MNSVGLLAAAGCGVLTVACLAAGSSAERSPGSVGIAYYMDSLSEAGFTGAVHVNKGGTTLLHRGYGSIAGSGSPPITDSTLFYLASLSKQFTATAALHASDEGCLDLDATLDRYLSRLTAEKARIRVEQLVAHTSGLPQYHARLGEDLDRAEAVRRITTADLESATGDYSYSNAGYTLLAALIESSCGTAFGDFLRTRILQPADLTDTYVLGQAARPHLQGARGYVEGQDQGTPAAWSGAGWAHLGAGGVLSSLRDMANWLENLDSCDLLTASSCARRFEPRVQTQAGQYAYGWRVTESSYGGPVVYHFGAEDNGHNAAAMWFTDQDLRIVVLSNRQVRDRALASATAVALARKILDPEYQGLPFYAETEN